MKGIPYEVACDSCDFYFKSTSETDALNELDRHRFEHRHHAHLWIQLVHGCKHMLTTLFSAKWGELKLEKDGINPTESWKKQGAFRAAA